MADAIEMECGYCLRKNLAIVEPKVLPCTHAHCLGCLTAYLNILHLVKCPTCSEVFDVTLDSLPTASVVEDNSPPCDVCIDDGEKDQPAVTYCMTCSTKYCEKHKQHHDAILKTHPKIGICEYRSRVRKLEVRTCTEHGVPLCLSCKTCLTVICVQCVSDLGSCADGSSHNLKTLDDLVINLTKEVNKLRSEVIDKEEQLEALFKATSENIADYETETREMVERIHQRRDEQIEAITEKYKSMEKQLIELRATYKSAMIKFMEEDVGIKLSELSKKRMRIEARVKHCHKVDLVTGYRDTKDDIQRLLDSVIPSTMFKPNITGEIRNIEMEIIDTSKIIEQDKELTMSKPIAKSLTLQQTEKLTTHPYSVCHYQGITYIGGYESVSRIDSSYQLMGTFRDCAYSVEGIIAYKDRIYTLDGACDSPYTVCVYDLSGQLITSWKCHTDASFYDTKFTIVSDQILIPNRTSKILDMFSLTGELLKSIPSPQLGNDDIAVSAVDNESVIVSDCYSDEVFRLNVSSGEVIWTFTDVTDPQGVVCYRETCVLVSSNHSNEIQILDLSTGALLSKVATEELNGNIYDLHIFGNTLVVPNSNSKSVMFYQID